MGEWLHQWGMEEMVEKHVMRQRYITDFNYMLNILYFNLADEYTSFHICVLNVWTIYLANQTKQQQLNKFLKTYERNLSFIHQSLRSLACINSFSQSFCFSKTEDKTLEDSSNTNTDCFFCAVLDIISGQPWSVWMVHQDEQK